MDSETQKTVEEAVLEILRSADMDEMTEYKVRALAADRLGIDLSLPDRKRFVRGVVESFLASHKGDTAVSPQQKQEQAQDQEQEQKDDAVVEEEGVEEEDNHKSRPSTREYDDEGDLIVCRLSNKRRVTIQEFRGKTLVSIREYYEKEGKELPTAKGISLTVEQWDIFAKAAPAIEKAVKKMVQSD